MSPLPFATVWPVPLLGLLAEGVLLRAVAVSSFSKVSIAGDGVAASSIGCFCSSSALLLARYPSA